MAGCNWGGDRFRRPCLVAFLRQSVRQEKEETVAPPRLSSRKGMSPPLLQRLVPTSSSQYDGVSRHERYFSATLGR